MKAVLTLEIPDALLEQDTLSKAEVLRGLNDLKAEIIRDAPDGMTVTLRVETAESLQAEEAQKVQDSCPCPFHVKQRADAENALRLYRCSECGTTYQESIGRVWVWHNCTAANRKFRVYYVGYDQKLAAQPIKRKAK